MYPGYGFFGVFRVKTLDRLLGSVGVVRRLFSFSSTHSRLYGAPSCGKAMRIISDSNVFARAWG